MKENFDEYMQMTNVCKLHFRYLEMPHAIMQFIALSY